MGIKTIKISEIKYIFSFCRRCTIYPCIWSIYW